MKEKKPRSKSAPQRAVQAPGKAGATAVGSPRKKRTRKAVVRKTRNSAGRRAKAVRPGSKIKRPGRRVVRGSGAVLKDLPETAAEPEAGNTAALSPMQPATNDDLPGANAGATEIPPILFEGDEASPRDGVGPGEKYVLGPTPPAGEPGGGLGHLPATYGTGKLLLVARDPHWLYAHWDLSEPQQRRYNALSADRHLVVRLTPGTISGHSSSEIHVHPESRHWFIHVDRAATQYTAELGYHRTNAEWVTVAASTPVRTPPDTASKDRTERFATIPLVVRLRPTAPRAPRAPTAIRPAPPRPVQPVETAREHALRETIGGYFERRDLASSAEVPELIRGRAGEKGHALQAAVPAAVGGLPAAHAPEVNMPGPRGFALEGVSSPMGGEAEAPKGFWFKVNAELVVYGATEPDAAVMLGRWPVQVRPDGTFSLRFALPDGGYELVLSALSVEGESRQAVLKVSRSSEYQGEVGVDSQDEALTVPEESL